MNMQFINEQLGVVQDFLVMGGPVLLLIGGLLFLMWSLIFERVFYFNGHQEYNVLTTGRVLWN